MGRVRGEKARVRPAPERELYQHYRSLVEQMQEGIAILQLRPFRVVFSNKALARMSGYRVRELTRLAPGETARRIHPEDRARVLGYMRRRLAGRKAPLLYACRIVRKDGSVCHVEISSRRVIHQGKPAIQATFIDRTRPKVNEKKLSLLSRAVEQVGEGVAIVTMGGTVLYVNSAFSAMHGYTSRSLVGKNLVIFHAPSQMPAVRTALGRMKAVGHFSGEIWHARRDGTPFPTLMETSLVRDENGKAVAIVGTCRDITEIRNATQELMRSQEEKARILDTVSESIAHKDARFRILWANRAAARRAGIEPRELLGRRCYEVWYGRRQPCPRCPSVIVIRTGQPAWGESAVQDGRRYLIGSYPVKDAEGRISGSVDVAIEAGERDRAEELHNLRSFSKMLIDLQEEERRRMALELHDQVGQSLTVVKLHLHRIVKECTEGGRASPQGFAEAFSLIDAAVNDIRAISHRLRPPALDILGLVPSLTQLVESLAMKSGMPIGFSARGVREKMDARIEIALFRVAQEALNNALKYSGCTRVGVSLRGQGKTLMLRIVDNGRGFAPLRANRMSGLGITGMRERIEGVGGSFSVRSGPCEGTRIEARVPLPLTARRSRRKEERR